MQVARINPSDLISAKKPGIAKDTFPPWSQKSESSELMQGNHLQWSMKLFQKICDFVQEGVLSATQE